MPSSRKRILGHSIAAFLCFLIPFLLVLLLSRDYRIVGWGNACLIAGVVVTALFLMTLLIRTGVFDVLNYGFYRLGESFRRVDKKRWDSAYDYKEDKKSARGRNKPIWFPYLIFGGGSLTAGIILSLIADSMH